MAGLPQALPKNRTQPGRAPPPSTVSGTSSTSSNATVVPNVSTPRARSPNSKFLPLPDSSSNAAGWSVQVENGSGAASTRRNGAGTRHAYWDAPTGMAQDVALLDEKTILHGLSWRLEQFLDIKPPYGLITPEIVEAARADMNICGPAIDMLASAVLADGDPPVCELPFVRTDESGNQRANYTVPLTIKNSPEALKKLLSSWAGVVQQLRQLDPQFHTEIARNICDLDPLRNVLSPQVARIAADLKRMAEEISLRRIFLDRFSEVLMERLRESEGSTLNFIPDSRALLPSVTEDHEPDSSSNSSRPSSRSSRRSRSGSKQQHDRRRWGRAPEPSDASGQQVPPSNGLRSRSSSSSSVLRLDRNGVPLEDGAEIRNEEDVSTSHLLLSARGNHVASSPRERPSHIIGGSQLYERGPSPANSRPDIYNGILPLTIPAFSGEESTSNIASDQNRNLPQPPSTSSPNSSSKPEMLAALRMDTSSPSANSLYGHRLPVVPPQRTHSPAQSAWSTEAAASGVASARSRGPRPLPPRPSRSPKPEVAQSAAAPPPPPAAPAPVPAMTQPVQLNLSWIVPDQGGSSSYVADAPPYQIPSQDTGVFVVPSSIPSQAEVSSSSQGLDAARQRYAMETTSSLHSLESDYRGMSLLDMGGSGAHTRNGRSNMATNATNGASGTPPKNVNNDLRHANSASPLIPTWTTPETFRAIANSSSYHNHIAGINGPGSSWVSPSSWHGPPTEINPPPKESSGLFSGMKSWVTGGSSKGSRNVDTGNAASTSGSSRGSDSQNASSSSPGASRRSPPRNLGDAITHAPSPFTPDSATAYYFGGQHGAPTSRPSSASSQPQLFSMNGYVVPSSTMASSQHRVPVGGISNHPSQSVPLVGGKPVSPGFAETYQVNPIAASIYYGAGPSGTRHAVPAPQFPTEERSLPPPPPPSSNGLSLTPEIEAIRETMYGAIMEALGSQALRQVMAKDSQRAFFSAMSLANLNVSMTLQPGTSDSPNLVVMMGREIRLTDLPGSYRTCITELAAIGREARKLSEEDDERAIAYVARGKPLPEPRIGRVRKLLERGVGFVGADGRVRGSKESSGNGTGRSREFSNKISALSIEMMKLPAFQEDTLRAVVG